MKPKTIDIKIKKDTRSSRYYHRTPPGTNANKAKLQASRDITASKFFNKNYLNREYEILQLHKIKLEIIHLEYP
jgi:hypothetical protein